MYVHDEFQGCKSKKDQVMVVVLFEVGKIAVVVVAAVVAGFIRTMVL